MTNDKYQSSKHYCSNLVGIKRQHHEQQWAYIRGGNYEISGFQGNFLSSPSSCVQSKFLGTEISEAQIENGSDL